MTSTDLAAALAASGLPIVNVESRTAETDPNKLLGRPGQYVGKVGWTDSRLIDPGYTLQPDGKWRVDPSDLGRDEMPGGTIESFADPSSLDAWFKYTGTISKSSALFAQYIYRNDRRLVVMRLAHELTPEQAADYEKWLGML